MTFAAFFCPVARGLLPPVAKSGALLEPPFALGGSTSHNSWSLGAVIFERGQQNTR
jgi:hypothetical protein